MIQCFGKYAIPALASFNHNDDGIDFFLTVYSVFIIDTVQTIMTGVDAYYWFGTGFGDLTHLGNVYISYVDVPILGSVLALLGQMFLCYRIYILSKNKWGPLFLFAVRKSLWPR